ncbi:MAG: hypothetical protein ACOYN4_02415 [Bacteroidales bacterium]
MNGKNKLAIKEIFSKPIAIIVVATVLLLPLLLLGTRTSHDWGDDFAQYIHQAANIVNHIPQSETGFVYSQLNYIGPQAYPIGFPLLLSPVYALAGNSMLAFTTYISLIYIVLGLLIVVFYRHYFTWFTSLVLAFVFVYNPQMIIFKREIMSDISFTALLVFNFILYQRVKSGNWKQITALAFMIGLMLIIRPAGIVFVAAVLMEQMVRLVKRKTDFRRFFYYSCILIFLPVFLYFTVNSVVFNIPSGGSIRDYLLFYYSGNFLQIIPGNFAHHIEVFRFLYIPQAGAFNGFSYLLGAAMLTMALLGFVKRSIQSMEATEWFFVFYAIMLLVFPNNDSAFRLMVPLGFLCLFYAAIGLKTIQLFVDVEAWKKTMAAGIIILLLFIPGLYRIAQFSGNTIEGPQQKSAIETFAFISKNIPADSVVVFAKPRALALYGGCKSMAEPFTTNPTLIHEQVIKAKASYLLIHSKLTSVQMLRYSRVMQNRLSAIWRNKDFTLYKINPVNPLAHR